MTTPKPPRQATAKPAKAEISLPAYLIGLERKLAGLDELETRQALRRELALWIPRYERLACDEDLGFKIPQGLIQSYLAIITELSQRVSEQYEPKADE
jgi:hypothetical protein